MSTFVLALASIVMSVAAQFLLKQGAQGLLRTSAHSSWVDIAKGVALDTHILLGFLLYGLGALVWLAVLAKWDVSKAYPLVGFGFVLTLFVGAFFGESVTPMRIVGVVCICLGVGLVARS